MMVIPNETTHVLLTQHIYIYIYISIAANISNIVSMIKILILLPVY